jgi:transposase-like protein
MEYKEDFKRNRCKSCKKDFSIKSGTIFEDSNIPLKKWFMAMYIFNV